MKVVAAYPQDVEVMGLVMDMWTGIARRQFMKKEVWHYVDKPPCGVTRVIETAGGRYIAIPENTYMSNELRPHKVANFNGEIVLFYR